METFHKKDYIFYKNRRKKNCQSSGALSVLNTLRLVDYVELIFGYPNLRLLHQ